MNNKLENILKRGMIETLGEAELFWDKAYIEIYRRYKHRERIHANLRLFESRKYYAQISYLTYERTPSSLLNQSMKFYGPKGEVSTYEELVEMKKEIDLEEYLFDKHRNVRCCFYNGSVDTEEIAKWFLLFADSIYSTGGNSINIRKNFFCYRGLLL